jgi:hypothetical protein
MGPEFGGAGCQSKQRGMTFGIRVTCACGRPLLGSSKLT